MDPDEVPVAILAGVVTVAYWGSWLWAAGQTTLLVRPTGRGTALLLCLAGSFGVVLVTLLTWADPVVRRGPGYIALFLAVAGVAFAAATAAGAVIGVSALDDAVRRPNPAAVWATAGLWLGTGLAVAGANIGRGDTIGTTLGPLFLGVAALLALWAIHAAATNSAMAISQGRDVPTAIRVAGLLIAWGLIFARATAGDWESVARTWEDFAVQGWPAVALLVIAIPIEWRLRPSARRPAPSWQAGVGPGIVYLAVAAAWVAWWGRP
ncbi:MAG TPA: hypothetical protein VKD90_23920 [Gemmataceae bacterium]|nr:hypothetical protein [Gemmataceae bacterium]